MKLSAFATLATTLVVSLSGCATGSDSNGGGPGSVFEEGFTRHQPLNVQNCAPFDRRPSQVTTTLSNGDRVGVPFRSCELNSSAIFGTIDLDVARQLLSGTGHVPLEVVRSGRPTTGLARLYFVNYLDVDIGPYNEFIFLVDAAEENGPSDAKSLQWSNSISTLLPAFDPASRTMLHQLILPKEARTGIAYGRELLGLDKRAGAVDLDQSSDAMIFSVRDETGAPVVRGAIRPDKRLTTLMTTTAKLAHAAIGERLTPKDIELKLHPLQLRQPIEVDSRSFSRDVAASGRIADLRSTTWWFPTMNEATDDTLELEIDAASALGRQLRDAHFTPTAVVSAENVSFEFARE